MRMLQRGCLALIFLLGAMGIASASITGAISGVVTDPSGAVIAGASVIATNTQTGIKATATTDSKGYYSLPALPVGTYYLEISQTGFRTERLTGLVIDANSALRSDATLRLGAAVETMVVTGDAVHVETESTQMGDVITSKAMTAVPLNGRAYTDLLALQPGVSPYTASDTGTAGISDRSVDGGLNSGNQSVNGQRETANGFMVNGSNVEEGKNNGAAIIPNLDSISEFRIITNNFNAEYGNYSGGQINVVTKSGTNQVHGSGFEFLRNTALDAKNYYASSSDKTPVFRQNQFGGTVGGPIKRDKTFFFLDYQGTRQTQAPTVNTQMPSPANFTGNFTDSTGSFTTSADANNNPIATTVNGGGWASTLSGRLGYAVNNGEPYYYTATTINPATIDPNTGAGSAYGVNCTSNNPVSGCVFPGAVIPKQGWSPVAANMLSLGLIPQPNAPNNFLVTSAYAQTLRDDKGGVRIDQNSRFGMIFAYYFADDYLLNSPFPNGGASVPAASFVYNANTAGRAQLLNLGNTKNIGALAVNEFRFSYVRNTLALTQPQGGWDRTTLWPSWDL